MPGCSHVRMEVRVSYVSFWVTTRHSLDLRFRNSENTSQVMTAIVTPLWKACEAPAQYLHQCVDPWHLVTVSLSSMWHQAIVGRWQLCGFFGAL